VTIGVAYGNRLIFHSNHAVDPQRILLLKALLNVMDGFGTQPVQTSTRSEDVLIFSMTSFSSALRVTRPTESSLSRQSTAIKRSALFFDVSIRLIESYCLRFKIFANRVTTFVSRPSKKHVNPTILFSSSSSCAKVAREEQHIAEKRSVRTMMDWVFILWEASLHYSTEFNKVFAKAQ
jgi:hypothetical protein